jgi:hypothetical protein
VVIEHFSSTLSSISQALMKHFQTISEELMKHLKKPLDSKMQFKISYHVSNKYSGISEAFSKHF